MRQFKIGLLLLLSMVTLLNFAFAGGQPGIQIALLLDTSNSMDGLIEQAKARLWRVVNEFALARQDGQAPLLEIALYEYGNDGLSGAAGYIRRVAPLTTDLDLISEELFRLTTNGGSELCGWVIQDAVRDLSWDRDPAVFKAIFIAGNEPFTQGEVDYRKACKAAISRGILVNTIYCGDYETGIREEWQSGAELADGKYMNIDQDQAIVHIPAPQDSLIHELNRQLNQTYLAYGAKGHALKERQALQDANALSLGPAVVAERVLSKSTANYRNKNWDLVDALEDESVDIKSLSAGELPEEMRQMSPAEREAYVREAAEKRREIKAQIRQLSEARRVYLAEHRRRHDDLTLDDAIIAAVREQAAQKGFTFGQ